MTEPKKRGAYPKGAAKREEILLALVDEREHSQEVEVSGSNWTESFYNSMLQNMENEALTRLWANLVGEATDRQHPAHDYFLNRYRKIREQFASSLASSTSVTGEDRLRASILIAVWDGLQTQWLVDDDFDMREPLKFAMKLLSQKNIA